MTLTEQLYEGTLPTGWYYFNNGVETYIVLYSNANTKYRKLQEPSGLTVLGEVPSYEDWKFAQEQLHKEGTWYTERAFKNVRKAVRELARKLLQTNPDLEEWLEKNYGEYL
jgi:hypothetical protein